MKITMPAKEVIVERLESVLKEGSDIARFYSDIAEQLSSRELIAQGFYLKWQLAMYPYTSDPMGVPHFGGLIMMNFDEYVAALFPEYPEFINDVMEWHNQVTA